MAVVAVVVEDGDCGSVVVETRQPRIWLGLDLSRDCLGLELMLGETSPGVDQGRDWKSQKSY